MFFNDYNVFIYIALFVLVYNVVKHFVKYRAIKNLIMVLGSLLVLLTVVREHYLIVLIVMGDIVILIAGNSGGFKL